jgi:hypothetical protein
MFGFSLGQDPGSYTLSETSNKANRKDRKDKNEAFGTGKYIFVS